MITYCYAATPEAAAIMRKLSENQRLAPGALTEIDHKDVVLLREGLVAIPVVVTEQKIIDPAQAPLPPMAN